MAGTLGLGALAFLGLTARLFVWPASGAPARADAVVVLGSEVQGRLDAGLRLIDEGVARTLVLSIGGDADSPSACTTREPYRVLCFKPQPFTTRGEAREIRLLASRNGWRSLAVVTSTYHVSRAGVLVGRCFDGEVDMVGAASGLSARALLRRIGHEWGGLLYAWTWARGC